MTTTRHHDTLAADFAVAINTAELSLVDFLTTIPADARHATALAVRRRTISEAHRYTHAADLAERMPALFTAMRADGRFSVDHLNAIWTTVNRHTRALATAGAHVPATLDTAVALAVAAWIANTGITPFTALADVAAEVLCTLAPLAVADTEADEATQVSLTRRGTRLTLDCGSPLTADALWSAITTAALEVRREIIADQQQAPGAEVPGAEVPAPGMAHCRGQVTLGLLGARRDQLNVTVNAYRPGPGAPAYVLGAGWVSPTTGAELAGLAARVRRLPALAEIPDTGAYPFMVGQKAGMEGRDAHCRFPGCTVPADRCEHDHLVNSAHTDPTSNGATSVSNAISLCRTHHMLKTAGVWEASSPDDAVTVDWDGPGGIRLTTVAAGPLAPVHHPD